MNHVNLASDAWMLNEQQKRDIVLVEELVLVVSAMHKSQQRSPSPRRQVKGIMLAYYQNQVSIHMEMEMRRAGK